MKKSFALLAFNFKVNIKIHKKNIIFKVKIRVNKITQLPKLNKPKISNLNLD